MNPGQGAAPPEVAGLAPTELEPTLLVPTAPAATVPQPVGPESEDPWAPGAAPRPARGRRRAPRRRPGRRARPAGGDGDAQDPRATPSVGSVLTWTLGALSLVAVWTIVFATVLSGLQERGTQRADYTALRAQLTGIAATLAPLGGVIKPGTPVAILDAPSAGLTQTVVVEGTDARDLEDGPGHLRSSLLPGQPGLSVVYGKAVTYGAPFARVPSMHAGDVITATTSQGVFHYTVSDVREAGAPLPPALQAGAGRLTLVTATGPGWRGRWAPTQTVYVDATLTDKSVPAPTAQLAPVTTAELPMHGDPGGLVPLVPAAAALLLAAVALSWTRARWGGWQTWLVGAPVVLALLWLTTQSASVLLPNLF